MTLAILLAGLAGGCAVAGAWEALAALEHGAPARLTARLIGRLRVASRAGREPTAPERRRLAFVGAATLFTGGWLVAGPVVGVAAAATGPWATGQAIRARRERWRSGLVAAAPAVARSLADALSGGHSIRGALTEAARGGGLAPQADAELKAIAATLALGVPTERALERLRERAAHLAFDTLVAAILLQRGAGGDLAGLLRELAADLEAAQRVDAEARAATAQARFTAWLVAALPVGAALLVELADPGAMLAIATDSLARLLAGGAVVLTVAGLAAVHGLARLKDA